MATPSIPPKQIPVALAEELWEEAGALPCTISVDLRLHQFTVRSLLRLEPGVVLEAILPADADVPLTVNAELIGWGEFEVVGERLAVRLTEIC
jgi:flagellar motor switch/type III secretory pathway protein FliN